MKKVDKDLTAESAKISLSSRLNFLRSLWGLCALCGSIIGCDKGEIPIAPREPGDVITAQVEMGSDYRHVIYYNLLSNSIVHSHLKTDWDLGFETGADGWHVILNTSKAMAASPTFERWLSKVTNDNDAIWGNDAPSGNLDSTAIGDWINDPQVFLIDRGYDFSANALGVMKIRIEETATGYRIHFADVAAPDSTTLEFDKDDNVNFVCVSLEGAGSVADIEPVKEDWHLKFSQYTHIFDEGGEIIPYSVTGALINPSQMEGVLQTEVPFDSIDIDLAQTYSYSNAWDVVGYNWKYFDLDNGGYTVFPEMVYCLRSSAGVYWKLHFTDFYDENGLKGAPKFEFQEL